MSEKQEFSEIGERIRSAIQDAMETGDFGQINAVVNDTVGGAMEEVRRQVNQAHERINRPLGDRNTGRDKIPREDGAQEADYASRYRSKHTYGPRRTMYASDRAARRTQEAEEYKESLRAGNREQRGANDGTNRMTVYRGQGTTVISRDRQVLVPARYFHKNGKVAGVLFTVFGGIGIGLGSLFTFLFLITWLAVPDTGLAWMTTIFALLTGGFGIMLKRGCGLQARLKRAERYLRIGKEKMYLELEDLAARTGQSLRKVRKDVRKMLRAGIFPEGHLDAKETVLMLSDESWQQYGNARAEQEKCAQAKEAAEEEAETEIPEGMDMTAEQQIEQEGRNYMERLRQLNIEIPGEVISNKLYQLDYLLQRIFMVLKEHPEKCPQMRKFMDYYLPTTVKLVESYADFDKAGVQGENIRTAKAEIEKTMDTINQAFEKLLDDMYQDAAFEAAADAKVLKTVLAQDGYMKSEFFTNTSKEGEA